MSAAAAAAITAVQDVGRHALGRTSAPPAVRRRRWHGHRGLATCAGHQLSGGRSFGEAADGQSADRSGSYKLPPLFLQAGPVGGRQPGGTDPENSTGALKTYSSLATGVPWSLASGRLSQVSRGAAEPGVGGVGID